MIVGQRPGASPKLLFVILALLAGAWAVREATHRSAPAARAPTVQPAAPPPASLTIERPVDSHAAGR
jgi:hypothetical protein